MVPVMAAIERYSASTVPVLADRVSRVLGASGLIALPTESFYGLAVAPSDEQALARLWQVKGRSRVKFDEMVRLDLRYARTWSPWLDVKILLQTPKAVVLGDGAF